MSQLSMWSGGFEEFKLFYHSYLALNPFYHSHLALGFSKEMLWLKYYILLLCAEKLRILSIEYHALYHVAAFK